MGFRAVKLQNESRHIIEVAKTTGTLLQLLQFFYFRVGKPTL